MIEKGFKNVKVVKAREDITGGDEMERFFEHYKNGKIINPVTGKVTVIKP